jgi:hypothetical protein
MQGLGPLMSGGGNSTNGQNIPNPFSFMSSGSSSNVPRPSTTTNSSQTNTSTPNTTTTTSSNSSSLPNANLTIHLHVQMNEIEQLPQQLARLRSMVNLTSDHQTGSSENIQIQVTQTPQPNSGNNSTIQPVNFMNTVRNTVRNNPNQNLSTVLEQITTELGIEETGEKSILDSFVTVATDCLDMGDMFQLTLYIFFF